MSEYFVQAGGWIIPVIWWIIIYRSFNTIPKEYRGILAAGLVPVTLGLSLGYILLLSPNLSLVSLRLGYVFVSLGVLGWVFTRNHKRTGFSWSFSLLLPFLISIPVFLLVLPTFTSFDPANYALIGKTIIGDRAIRAFPFVLPNRGTPIFSWFAHPPLLSLIYSWLSLFQLGFLSPYVSTFFFMLLLMLVFAAIQKKNNITIAIACTLLLGTTPLVVHTAVLGFTASLRMFFFTAVGVVIADDTDNFFPVTIGIFAGTAMATHTIGLLTIPAVVLYIFIRHKEEKWRLSIRFVTAALAVGGFWYGWNLIKLGSLDATPLFQAIFPDLTKKAIIFQFNQRSMHTSFDILTKGILGPATRLSSYGITFLFGFLSLMLTVIRKQHRPPLSILLLLIVYLVFHLFPGHFRIAILSPRYPLTVLPLLLIAGSYGLRGGIYQMVGFSIAIFASVISFCLWNPYQQKPDPYKSMVKIVQKHVSKKDRVLVVHNPYFFLYNQRIGQDSMDPELADLYHSRTLEKAISTLKHQKFTHILMPWSPTPFESDSFIKQLFVTPGLVQAVGHTRAFYLYKICYPVQPVSALRTACKLLVSTPHALPVLAYSNVRKKVPIRFWDNGNSIHVLSLGRNTVFAFAHGPLWEVGAGTINTKGYRKIRVSFSIGTCSRRRVIHPLIAQYDEAGKRISLSHSNPITLRPGQFVLTWPTVYPGFSMQQFQLDPACDSIALGFSFYREKGGMSIEKLAISGCR